jgi:hypothetical protein
MKSESHVFRLRAIQSEQRARDVSDPVVKAEWEELAIEWHALASAASRSLGDDDRFEFG